ncbi:MAG: TlpA disulfide reductase family protein [Weeksellaceae bacterium]|nr:TlpA disulfide reductase family protein [Weeksellaceae bacterium]
MKKKITILLFALATLNTYSQSQNTKDYLRIVLNNLEKVESATYNTIKEGWAPADTAASVIMNHFVKEYNNPQDSTIGASFVNLLQKDTTQMTFCYDGKMRAIVYKEEREIVIDSFKVKRYPFRPLSPPFFNRTKSIIKYALETKDSISIKIDENQKYVYCCLTIFKDQQVEFFGKAYYTEKNPYDFGELTSKYEIWIDKSTDLPFKIRREMSHNISVETISNVSLNKIKINDFKASDHFQPNYKITAYRTQNQKRKENKWIGKKAPDWTLLDTNNKTQSLKGLKSKVVMIQFTSVSCGPCRVSIPFLNKLTSAYDKKDFDFVAIECTANNLRALQFYQNKNAINYKFLKSTTTVLKDYEIVSYPVFFILDKERIIRNVISGYGKETTDKEIRNTIDKLIK